MLPAGNGGPAGRCPRRRGTLVISTATNQFAAAKRIVIRPSSGQSSGSSQAGTVKVKPASGTASAAKKNLPDELRGIWISYLDFNTLLKNKSASAFKTNIGGAFDNIAALHRAWEKERGI